MLVWWTCRAIGGSQWPVHNVSGGNKSFRAEWPALHFSEMTGHLRNDCYIAVHIQLWVRCVKQSVTLMPKLNCDCPQSLTDRGPTVFITSAVAQLFPSEMAVLTPWPASDPYKKDASGIDFVWLTTKRTRQRRHEKTEVICKKHPWHRLSSSEQYNKTVRNLSNKIVQSNRIKNNEANFSVMICNAIKYILESSFWKTYLKLRLKGFGSYNPTWEGIFI